MLTLRPKFLLAAAFLTTTAALSAASFFPTSPLIQIGEDTDIFFTANTSLNITDNLYSSATKTSATSYTLVPGFSLEYAKDSPLYATASISRSLVRYASISKLNNSQNTIDGAVIIDQGGPLKAILRSSYHESARNDNLTSLGIDGKAIGETLVRQGDYQHSLKLDYRLTEKILTGVTFTNSYNRYLNPVTIIDPNNSLNSIYNTNNLSQINTKNIGLAATYCPPGDLITYGLTYSHAQNDFSPAPYLSTNNVLRPAGIYKSTQDNFNLTASGSLTRSGKLSLSGSLGALSSKTLSKDTAVGDTKSTDLSYAISLKHNLSEFINHEINLGRSVSPTPSGTNSQTSTYGYSISSSLNDSAAVSFNITKASTAVGPTKIESLNYGASATYRMNAHLNFSANLSMGDTKFPGNSVQNSQTKGFILSADFRY